MKDLLAVFIEKLKQLEAEAAIIVLTIIGLFTIGMSTIVAVKVVNMVIKIAEILAGPGDAHKSVF